MCVIKASDKSILFYPYYHYISFSLIFRNNTTIPTDPIKDKMDHHESKSLAQVAAETMLNPKFKSMKETWRYDYSAKIGNTDIKGLIF